jgi:hypothetical protein
MNAAPDSHRSLPTVRAHSCGGSNGVIGGTVDRPRPDSDELLVAVYAASKVRAAQTVPSHSSRASCLRERETTKCEVVQE